VSGRTFAWLARRETAIDTLAVIEQYPNQPIGRWTRSRRLYGRRLASSVE
jgi:hypothetical protein